MSDLWWTNWHWDRLFSEHFVVLLYHSQVTHTHKALIYHRRNIILATDSVVIRENCRPTLPVLLMCFKSDISYSKNKVKYVFVKCTLPSKRLPQVMDDHLYSPATNRKDKIIGEMEHLMTRLKIS
jgi:hypothetical protein